MLLLHFVGFVCAGSFHRCLSWTLAFFECQILVDQGTVAHLVAGRISNRFLITYPQLICSTYCFVVVVVVVVYGGSDGGGGI